MTRHTQQGDMHASRITTSFTAPILLAAGTSVGSLRVVSAQVATPAVITVMAWGDNSAGELGNGSLTRSTAQVAVGALGGSRASPLAAPMDSPCAPTARPPSWVLIPHAGELHG